jgi:hypothetical protein
MGRDEATGGGREGGGAATGGESLPSLRFLVNVFASFVGGAAGFVIAGTAAVSVAPARDSDGCRAATFIVVVSVVLVPTLVEGGGGTTEESFDSAAFTADECTVGSCGAAEVAACTCTRLAISVASLAIFSLSSRLLDAWLIASFFVGSESP